MNNKILRLTSDSRITTEVQFSKGQLFQFIRGVLYINSLPVRTKLQKTIVEWMEKNPTLFKEIKDQHE